MKRNYKFYRVFVLDGSTRLKRSGYPAPLGWLRAFMQRHALKGQMRVNDIPALSAFELIQRLDAQPIDQLPTAVELVDPVGRVIRRWSRVKNWNL